MNLKAAHINGLCLLMSCLILSACASSPRTPETKDSNFRDRIQEQSSASGIVVRAGVPSGEETETLFGSNLYQQGVQPVWLEIVNNSGKDLAFLPIGLDPAYFSPIETANLGRSLAPQSDRDEVREANLFGSSMRMSVPAGSTRVGFVFSKLDEGTKAFNIDLTGEGFFESFTFFIQVPGLRVDHYEVNWKGLYSGQSLRDLDDAGLLNWLDAQVCCTTDKQSEGSGDPLNLVIIGHPTLVYNVFIRAGWDETETITSGTTLKTIGSFFTGSAYRYSPVSGLYWQNRPQDVAFQKIRNNIHERNHLRLWLAPVTHRGTPVFVGQISRDIGVRFTRKTITTHKIDPNVDETREYLLENLAYAQSLDSFGYGGGVGRVTADQPAGNLTGDPWFSDGHRLILWVSENPVDIHSVRPREGFRKATR